LYAAVPARLASVASKGLRLLAPKNEKRQRWLPGKRLSPDF
jgi:hypothetical protein